jgi:hypothetical protein
MIVEGHEEGVRRVRTLQVGVALVLGVAAAIVVERRDERAGVLTDGGAVRAVFVDIVAIVEDERQLLVSEVAIGGVLACLEILAARDPEAEL